MATAINYVVRIVKNTCKDGDKIVINLNSNKFPEIKYHESCKVSVIGSKLVFIFKEKDGKSHDIGKGRITFFAKTSSLYIATFTSKKMIEDLLPFCGEYDDIVLPDSKEQSSNMPKFWIGLNHKQNLTNIYKNTSTEVSQVTKKHIIYAIDKPDNHEEAKERVKKLVEENSIKNQLINSYKTSNNVDIAKLVETKNTNLSDALLEEVKFAEYVIDEAHLCTQNMQRKFAALMSHRLNKLALTESDAIKHYDINKLLVNYIRLQDSVEKLMQNIIEEAKNGR